MVLAGLFGFGWTCGILMAIESSLTDQMGQRVCVWIMVERWSGIRVYSVGTSVSHRRIR